MAATVVLVHGAWHGAWCWERVVSLLDAAGVASVAVDLPSVNGSAVELSDDADHVRAAIDRVDGPVVLVGHSYGGAVVTDAGAHPAVEHVVYLSAFALDDGESVIANELEGGEGMRLIEALAFDDDVIRVAPDRATEFFFHDCEPDVAADAVARLRPHAAATFSGVPRAIAWKEKPATYAICTDDAAVPYALQCSIAKRCDGAVEWPASHSPFLSRPDLVADLLRDLAQ